MLKIAQNSELIKAWQKYLSSNAFSLSTSYTGGITGQMTPELERAVKEVEKQLQIMTGEPVIGKIMTGSNIIAGPEIINKLMNPYAPKEQPKQQPKQEKAVDVGVGAEKPVYKTDPKVIEFKKYFASKGYYKGDVNDPALDEDLINIMKALEVGISKILTNVSNYPPNSAVGLIWTGQRINPDTNPIDIENALKLIQQKALQKQGQATVDTWERPSADNPIPMAFNFSNQPIGYEDPGIWLEIPDPDDNQRQGIMEQKVPKDISLVDDNEDKEAEAMTMDDRIYKLAQIFKEIYH